ncbi:helix-turn-helix domain-containing protein [Saccharothrix saharensis]|uniref:helix-turn-helix domain-containing protein n=1 Tax=Saccharothrix saharensis TaxID=571190 RepID=UPI0036A08409
MDTEEKRPPVRSSTARSRELGEELRRARHHARMSAVEAVDAMQWSQGKLSKLETGSRGTSPWDVGSLLGLYRADKATRERVEAITSQPDTGTLCRLHDGSPDTLVILAVHEPIARTITTYEPLTVPALAQTYDYAHALTGRPQAAQARIDRQRQLPRVATRTMTLYLHEAALRAAVGSPVVMRDQLLHLTLMCGWTNTRVRLIPQARGLHAALRNPATMLTFHEPYRPLAYVETDAATVIHEDPDILDSYRHKMRELDRLALDPDESRTTLARWANVYERQAADEK